MNTKLIKGWMVLAATVCMAATAHADDYQILRIRTIPTGPNMFGVTEDQRLVGVACYHDPATIAGNIFSRGSFKGGGELIFFKDNVDFADFSNLSYRLMAGPRKPVRVLTDSAYDAICTGTPGDFDLAIYKDHVEVLRKVDLQAQSFSDILDPK